MIDSSALLGHAFLKKDLVFYSRLTDDFNFKFNNKDHVTCFGLDGGWANPNFQKQLRIYDYIDVDNFIFQVGCKDPEDEIYFAKVPSKGNLMDTYLSVMSRIKEKNLQLMGQFDQLQIPYLKFELINEFESLKGVEFANEKIHNRPVESFTQNISFDLTKDGVKLESKAAMVMDFGLSDEEPIVYAFDKPFLIVMKRKDTNNPYFLFWVQNAEHMRKID